MKSVPVRRAEKAWRITTISTVEVMALNRGAINRQVGLEQFFGGSAAGAALAFHMGPQEDIADQVTESSGLVCLDCAVRLPFAAVMELGAAQNQGLATSEGEQHDR